MNIKNIFRNNYRKGQISIIVMLASMVILTLSLSISKRTVTETKISTDEEALKQAFNAAESGINNYLNIGSTTYSSTSGDAAIVESNPIGNTVSISSEGQVLANDKYFFWLVNHNSSGDIGSTYYSGDSVTLTVGSGFAGSLEVDYFYLESGVYKVRRFGCNYSGNIVNGFDSNTASCSTIDTSVVDPLLIVVTPIGSATSLTLSGSSSFPLQGEELTSVGTTNQGVKTQVKTRNIYELHSFFLDALTARGRIE